MLDERLGFTRDCDLLVWFASRYGLEVRMEQDGMAMMFTQSGYSST